MPTAIYYQEHKANCCEHSKKYRDNNKPLIKAVSKEYAEKNREKINACKKEYRSKNKEKINAKVMCSCGAFINNAGMWRHLQTKRHPKALLFRNNICAKKIQRFYKRFKLENK